MSTKVAIVLAAGKGERMGGSKALLLVGGEPLAALHVARAIEAGCDRVIVVTRDEPAARLGEIPRATTLVRDTTDPAESLRAAVQKVGMRGDVQVLVTPVDCPPVAVATLKALFAALDAGAVVATPHREGKGGHPVACRVSVLAPYASPEVQAPTSSEARNAPVLLAPAPPLRDVLAQHEAGRARIEVEDARVGIELDTPEDVLAFTGKPPTFA